MNTCKHRLSARRNLIPKTARALLFATLGIVSGCQNLSPQDASSAAGSSAISSTSRQALSILDPWQVLPLANGSATDTAAEAADVILATHLRKRGVLMNSPGAQDPHFAVEGKVTRWHYAGGASARPVAQVLLDVRDVQTGNVVWSDSATETGRRGQSLSSLADHLIQALVERMPLSDSAAINPPSQPAAAPLPMGMLVDAGAARRGSAPGNDLIPSMALKTGSVSYSDSPVSTDQPLSGRSVAFYYAPKPPVDILSQFDRLVLEPDNITVSDLRALTARGARAYAYLSVGEVGPTRAYARELDPAWILGKNPAWDSDVLDLSNPALRDFLLRRAGQLQADGFGGLFLDTMDSFNLIAKTETERRRQQSGLVSLVAQFATRYPAMKIITNRGFEVMDEIAGHIEAIAAESLYSGWNNATQQYVDVPAGDAIEPTAQVKDLGVTGKK